MAKILVASAQSGIRTYLADGLAGESHTVFSADSQDSVYDLLAEERVDLLIADVFQPVLEGVAMIATVARTFHATRILALTDFTTARAHTYDLGVWADSTLAKPLSMERVSNEVDWVLEHGRVRAGLGPVSA